MIGLSVKRDAILEIREKQAEITRLIYNLESKEVRRFELPQQNIDLKEGEHYAGMILGKETGASHHLILLPGESEVINWASALSWAKSVGGELPTRREQSLLHANLKDQFKPTAYWSSEQHAEGAGYAWVQYFGHGDQGSHHKGNEWRARAVRRLTIQ